jgi:hypothetical protein
MKFVEAQSALVESNELDNGSLYMQLKTKSYLDQGDSVGACSRQLYREAKLRRHRSVSVTVCCLYLYGLLAACVAADTFQTWGTDSTPAELEFLGGTYLKVSHQPRSVKLPS